MVFRFAARFGSSFNPRRSSSCRGAIMRSIKSARCKPVQMSTCVSRSRGNCSQAQLTGCSRRFRVSSSFNCGGEAAAAVPQTKAIAAIANVLAPLIATVHITLSSPCGEQKRQNLGSREVMENGAGNFGAVPREIGEINFRRIVVGRHSRLTFIDRIGKPQKAS
jgi:hypothetical protein